MYSPVLTVFVFLCVISHYSACSFFFFFKQKTAIEMRIRDWSSDVCSSDLSDQPRAAEDHAEPRRIDLAGTLRIVLAIPGLFALILFSSFNNLLGGVFMALMDAYGLSLMKVEEWGLLWEIGRASCRERVCQYV